MCNLSFLLHACKHQAHERMHKHNIPRSLPKKRRYFISVRSTTHEYQKASCVLN
jgi:hypothetical protein